MMTRTPVGEAGRALGMSDLDPQSMSFREWIAALRKGETSPLELRGFTLYQPWATLMARGHKRLETRNWRAPEGTYPLLIAIHAGARNDRQAQQIAQSMQLLTPGEQTPRKAIVAIAWAQPPVDTDDPNLQAFLLQPGRTAERAFGDFSPNRFAWPMDIYPLLKPLPATGHFKLWKPSQETHSLLMETLLAPTPRISDGMSKGI